MRIFFLFIFFIMLVGLTVSTNAQVSNLIVCGSDTNWTFVSGSAVSWQYNVSPNGSTATAEFWLDVNDNGVIDSLIDKNRFTFNQTDGASGNDGPGDNDGTVNGVVTFSQAVGLAPGKYVFQVTQGGSSVSARGIITHISSPAHTISGTVIPPSGQSAANIFMQIQPSSEGDNKPFWEAVTDSNGDFAIEMDSDTTGNPWRLRLADNYNPFPGSVLSPSEYEIQLIGNPNGYTFVFTSAAAKIVGTLYGDDSGPLTNTSVYLNRYDNGANFNVNTNTDNNGFFEFGLSPDDLSNDDFVLGSEFNKNDPYHLYLAANVRIHGIHSTDSLVYQLVAYHVNSTIRGQVQINGSPAHYRIEVDGMILDTAWTGTYTDSTTGNFRLEVNNSLFNYQLFVSNLPENYFSSSVTAQPGDSDVIINITTVGVSEREQGIPATFSLGQNYPNPFNPTSTIDYDVAQASNVRLSLYNMLGEEVLNIVNQQQSPGKYRATIDGSSLSSGMYYYRLTAGTFTQTKKMLLMK